MSLATGVNLIFTVLTMFLGPILFENIHGWTFVMCAAISLLAGFFFLFALKETRGLSEKQVAFLYCDSDIAPFTDEN